MGSCCERLTLRWRPLPRKRQGRSRAEGSRLTTLLPAESLLAAGPGGPLRGPQFVVQVGSFSSGRAKLKSLPNTREIYRQSLQNFPQSGRTASLQSPAFRPSRVGALAAQQRGSPLWAATGRAGKPRRQAQVLGIFS